jgi:hypothetical protein
MDLSAATASHVKSPQAGYLLKACPAPFGFPKQKSPIFCKCVKTNKCVRVGLDGWLGPFPPQVAAQGGHRVR